MATLRKLKKIGLAFIGLNIGLALITTSSQASDAGTGYINHILVTSSGITFFNQTGARTAIPSCGAAFTVRWAFNVNTPAGQAMLSTILTAYSTGKPIVISGAGSCTDANDTESVGYLYIDG